MNIALWVAAGLLAAIYLFAGLGKLVRPYSALAEDPRMGWTNDYSAGVVKFIGVMEVLGAVALVVPALVGTAEILVPLAATGIALIAIGAIATHARRNEPEPMVANVFFALVALFVAVGRFWIEPF